MARLKMLPPRLSPLAPRVRPPEKKADDFYRSQEWIALRARLIRERGRRCESPTCSAPRNPRILIGDHVVEIKDGGAPLDPRNVRLLCQPCHNAKTAQARTHRLAVRHTRKGEGGSNP
jgi:5-methylcytosine-specific restriction protein A